MFTESTVKILFQGDSITDAGRSRDNDNSYGCGYPLMIAGKLGCDYPGQYSFINRGISGNRIVDLYARIKVDLINLTPDVISIMIGVNDVWHEVAFRNGVAAPKFELIYDWLLTEIKSALPKVQFILIEPFVLKGPATEAAFAIFHEEVALRRAATGRLAAKHGAALVSLQDTLDQASQTVPATFWTADGVHPTPAGHALIAGEWLKCFAKMVIDQPEKLPK